MTRTLWIDAAGWPATIDQTRLPFERITLRLSSAQACFDAIRSMQVRGAPLIGAVGAYGLALALRDGASDAALAQAVDWLASARPTAVNLRWALERVRQRVQDAAPGRRAELAWHEAGVLCDEDVDCNARIGEYGAELLLALPRAAAAAPRPASAERPLQVLTHCNAGRIATVDHGTALAPIYRLHEAGIAVHVWVDETRPRNQGALLTAWELAERGVPHTVIVDNAGGLLMRRGQVDAVIVGCDRVAANGDVANKIGTYLKALAAHDNDVPFYVACPVSTIDAGTPDGDAIPIEERDAREVTEMLGRAPDGRLLPVRIVPGDSAAANPAFDVTPARLVNALITEHGICEASLPAITQLLARVSR